jgi:hypothetical protein
MAQYPILANQLAGILRCFACGRSIDCSRTDMLRYAVSGWPRCCGEVLTLYTATEKPAGNGASPDDTRLT